eukprot:TRINITY_DN734_c0_g2_i1.p3 TRINITY_DN734_c0_g2~~TRINITY_DN734_c0_g2_i1.p3  ORF type:complete len:114 (-),score=5.72 TRINITY_DN734_c0_g2_i1:588-929(-)
MECIGGEEEELPKRPCPSRIITARHLRAVTRTPLADITRERVFMLLCCLRHRTALPLELIFPIVCTISCELFVCLFVFLPWLSSGLSFLSVLVVGYFPHATVRQEGVSWQIIM